MSRPPWVKQVLIAAAMFVAASSHASFPSFHKLTFDREPLSAVAARFNQVSPRKLQIVGPVVGQKRLSGIYWTDNPEGFVLAILDIYPDLVMHESTDGWTIEPRRSDQPAGD